jgi:succinate dehydrogenase/fumarate reductase flavoprotein subunit
VQLYVQNLMDFYCGDVRGGGLLARGLERLETAREAPLRAENPHELARALEVMSIVDNAELTLRACLERKETRPAFDYYRGDYPDQDDEQWLAFLVARREGRSFAFRKVPVAP